MRGTTLWAEAMFHEGESSCMYVVEAYDTAYTWPLAPSPGMSIKSKERKGSSKQEDFAEIDAYK